MFATFFVYLKKMFDNLFKKMRTKKLDYEKISLRASIKDLMKMRSLRTINIANYNRWKQENGNSVINHWAHSLRLNVLNGYIDVYAPRLSENDKRAGKIIDDVSLSQYQELYGIVTDILDDEKKMPPKVKRNILVKVNR